MSYLGDTINTISHRITGKKGIAKSAQPSMLNSQIRNTSKKSKNEYRSQAASPARKRVLNKLNKPAKLSSFTKNISHKQLIISLLNESQDNIMGYTNQSLQLGKIIKANEKQIKQTHGLLAHKTNNYKSQSPILQQQNLLVQIREYEKNAQDKKQHLNYIYLKQKIFMLASVKKIQRAWRNYITKKLIKSYSNKIVLQYTGNFKNYLSSADKQQSKVLTVKSSVLSQKNASKCQIKKNQFAANNEVLKKCQVKQPIKLEENMESLEKPAIQKERQNNVKSVHVQCQLEQLSRYEGKDVKEAPKIPGKKQKFQKQSFNNSHQINVQQTNIQKISNENIKNKKPITIINSFQSVKIDANQNFGQHSGPQNSFYGRVNFPQSSRTMSHQRQLQVENYRENKIEDDESEEGLNTQRRRRKLQFFENQIRKIDNQQSESNISQSNSSQIDIGQNSPITKCVNILRDAQQQQNMKLKRKLQAINRTQLLDHQKIKKNNQLHKISIIQHHQNSKDTQQQQIQQFNSDKGKTELEKYNNLAKFLGNKNTLNKESIGTQNFKQQLSDFEKYFISGNDVEKGDGVQEIKCEMKELQQISEKLQQQILNDFVKQLSKKKEIYSKLQSVYTIKNKAKALANDNKAEGICTNLQSIKDYLQNFVAFVFEQQSTKVLNGFNTPNGPNSIEILKFLNNNNKIQYNNFYVPVLSLELFNAHWQHATQQIYFDVKYVDDPIQEQKRVIHLKSITQTYFRAIFDGFNFCLQPFRRYGKGGHPFPWSKRSMASRPYLVLDQLKPLIRLSYRKLAQIATLYCGMLIQDKITMSSKIQQIEHNRLNALIQIQQHDGQIKWNLLDKEQTEVLWKLSKIIEQILIMEICNEHKLFKTAP